MRRSLIQVTVLAVVLSVIITAISLVIDWFPEQASTSADDVDLLYDVLLIVSVPIFVLVMTVVVYSVVRFRARPGDDRDGDPIHGNARLEIAWIAIPTVLVTALAVYAWVVLDDQEDPRPDTMLVNVRAGQFAWRFEYPQPGGQSVRSNELYLPKDRPVQFRIKTDDVVHSFWIPEFRIKQDTVPGIVTRTQTVPSRAGDYDVVCAELCGLGHSTMRQQVHVMEGDRFASWIGARRQALAAAAPEPGRQVFTTYGCAGCHTLEDAGAAAATGPSLDGLAEVYDKRNPRLSLEAYVRQSIVDPKALVVPGFRADGMPANYSSQLSRAEIDTLVDYLARASSSSSGPGTAATVPPPAGPPR
ncbi:MAG: cytochrome c oxidase subunit II [Thermoleophilaceae bacterium]|nr:cytochrome c oxidase subunit II [Thermoleophilaceae bacterium]